MTTDVDIKDRVIEKMLRFYHADRRWVWMKRAAMAISFTAFFLAFAWSFINANGRMPIFGEYLAVVPIKGEILDGKLASAEKVIPAMQNAFRDDNAKAVIFAIDSPGGSPLETERIYEELARLKHLHPKPVIAVINTVGTSAAYMLAIRADKVVAGKYSQVGSIGTIMKVYNVRQLADQVHVSQLTFVSGPLKAFLDPLGTPSKEQLAKAQDLVDKAAGYFKAEVEEHRAGKLKELNYYTGEIWLGKEALALGLIDEIGTLESVAQGHHLPMANVGPAPGLMAMSTTIDVLGASISDHLRAALDAPPVLR